MNNIPSALLTALPSGYFLAFERILDFNSTPFCKEPVLTKMDPSTCVDQIEAAYFYPGRGEEMLYQNPTKDTVQVEPLDDDYIDFLCRNSEVTSEIIVAMNATKTALDDPRPRIPFIQPFKK